MRIDIQHPISGARVLLNNAPVPYVHMADDVAGVVQCWEQRAGSQDLQLVEKRGWVTIVVPERPAWMALPFVAIPQWHREN